MSASEKRDFGCRPPAQAELRDVICTRRYYLSIVLWQGLVEISQPPFGTRMEEIIPQSRGTSVGEQIKIRKRRPTTATCACLCPMQVRCPKGSSPPAR